LATNIKLGDPAQNSYVNATQANAYFSNRRNTSEWDDITATGRNMALIQAANNFEQFAYIKDKYYDNQGLQFPRDNHEVIIGNCATPITRVSFRNSNLYSTTYMKYPTSYWKYGSVHITSGTPVNDIKLIASSNVTNGSITVTASFSATPTTDTEFVIFAPIDKEIQDAQCEQALFILKNSNIESLYSYRDSGARRVEIGDVEVEFNVTSGSGKVPISSEARRLLSRWIKKRFRMVRA